MKTTPNTSHKTLTLVIGAALFLGFGVIGGMAVSDYQAAFCEKQYVFINGDVACGNRDVIEKTGYTETREKVLRFLEGERAAGRLEEGSVYFRDLVHGPVFGVNELSDFAPASLLKLPLGIILMSAEEEALGTLATRLQYVGTTSTILQKISPSKSAQPDTTYTLEELLELMLSYSDNASADVLDLYMRDAPERAAFRLEVFQELGVLTPEDGIEETVSVRGYASLFRILYNVSYLNENSSEKLLGWLAESDYLGGLAAGVPKGVAIAHKFGERLIDGDTSQLHDCGIIYYPGNPYLLCIMTRGDNFDELAKVISTVSEMVYREVDSRRL